MEAVKEGNKWFIRSYSFQYPHYMVDLVGDKWKPVEFDTQEEAKEEIKRQLEFKNQ